MISIELAAYAAALGTVFNAIQNWQARRERARRADLDNLARKEDVDNVTRQIRVLSDHVREQNGRIAKGETAVEVLKVALSPISPKAKKRT